MKKKSTVAAIIMGFAASYYCGNLKAGDPTRSGQAGASELLIDPWAGTSGFGDANSASVQGIEAQFLNVAGTATLNRTEVILSSDDYLAGSGIHISTAGLSQPVGESGAFGLAIMSMNVGTINMTSYDYPDGGIGYFSPQLINIGASYARHFSDYIYGGLNVKLISEAISNVHAFGAAIDAGIQYVAGKDKCIHFGIALKNVGPTMNYSGDGLAFQTPLPAGSNTSGVEEAADQRSQAYELPSLVNIGAAYDFYLARDSGKKGAHRLTLAANFTSNSFTQDQEMVGLEYAFKTYFAVRIAYDYQNGATAPLSTDPTNGGRLTVFTGLCAGATLQYPVGKKHTLFGITYAYRATNPYQGCNTIGIKMDL